MADNLGYTEGSGKTVSTEEITTLNGQSVDAQHAQRVILATRSADGQASDVGAGAEPSSVRVEIWGPDDYMEGMADRAGLVGNALKVQVVRALPAGSNTIGAVNLATDARVIAAGYDSINDNYQRVHVDNDGDVQADVLTVPVPLSTTGGGTEATALRVTLASDSTGVVSVDDNGGSLTVDGTVAISGTVAVTDNSGTLSVDDGSGSITVDNGGTFAVQAAQSGTWNVGAISTSVTPGTSSGHLGKQEDSAHNSGDTGVLMLAVRNSAHASRTDADGDYTPIAVDAEGCVLVVGNVAHDAIDSDGPVKVGGKAVSAEPAAVAANDRANFITDLVGKLISLPYANPENFVAGKTAAITDTTRTAVIAAQGAAVRLYITHIIVTNSHASVGTYVKIEDGTTEIYGGYAAAAGGGFSITLPVPLRLTANTALNVSCGTTGANVYASASGYKGV